MCFSTVSHVARTIRGNVLPYAYMLGLRTE
jgi:hypothetical protein